MPVERLNIEIFLNQKGTSLLVDVRSPHEYQKAHIPGAQSLPLFSDEERAIIGTAYKQLGRPTAVNEGLKFFSSSMQALQEKALSLVSDENKTNPIFFLYCWRGGMRSNAVAWLLSLYGYQVFVLDGGYKAYRHWVLSRFEKTSKFKVIGGYTGSGKTELLNALPERKKSIIDLESLAHHKGSSFGDLGMPPQPTQEMFENRLANELGKIADEKEPVWIEDESRNIGRVQIPLALWNQMRRSELVFLEIPFEKRLGHILKNYGVFEREDLKTAILRIQKRLGGQATADAIEYLENGDIGKCFDILLHYYDKLYRNSLEKRLAGGGTMHKIVCENVDNINVNSL